LSGSGFVVMVAALIPAPIETQFVRQRQRAKGVIA
jgi:hypothetical protein